MKANEATGVERYGAEVKCRAVLAAWTESQPAAVVCRELGVSPSLFSQWQDRAMTGMLSALEPRRTRGLLQPQPALPVPVKRLLDRKAPELAGAWTRRERPVRPAPAPSATPGA